MQKTAAHQRKNFLIEQHDLMKLQFRRSSSLTAATAKNRNVSRRSPVRLAAVHSNGVGNADGDGDGDGDEIENNNLLTLLSDRDEITEQIETLHLEDEINQVRTLNSPLINCIPDLGVASLKLLKGGNLFKIDINSRSNTFKIVIFRNPRSQN